MSSLLMQYWWKNNSVSKGVCWVKRSTLEAPKGMGGIDLRNIEFYNKALLVKQAIRIQLTQTSLFLLFLK